MRQLDYGLFDADNHFYETRDCFSRYMEPKYRDKAVRLVPGENGKEQLMVGDKPFTFLQHPFPEKHAKPGSLREMLRSMSSGDYQESDHFEPVQPEYVNREARLAVMDKQGLEACFLFPTLGVCLEHFMQDDVEQTYANLHAFNRWLDEEWGFAYQGRIYAPPLLSLLDVERAVEELEWALSRGARLVHLRPGPVAGRSPADPIFDPFWARVNEARLSVSFHISESGYNEMMSVHWGEEPNPSSHRQSAFQWTLFYGDRPIMDTMGALILHNLFGRFPNVRVVSVENGSLWVPYLLQLMDKMKGMGRNGPWLGGYVKGRPSEIFKRHVYVSPHYLEDVVALAELIGSDHVAFGSDYPHAEAMGEPREFAELLERLPDEDVRRIMRENARGLVSEGA